MLTLVLWFFLLALSPLVLNTAWAILACVANSIDWRLARRRDPASELWGSHTH
jgi:hypothetical protein